MAGFLIPHTKSLAKRLQLEGYSSAMRTPFRLWINIPFSLLILFTAVPILFHPQYLIAQDEKETKEKAPAKETTDKETTDTNSKNAVPNADPNSVEEKEEPKLYPTLEEMMKLIPSAKDLVQEPPVDWMVLDETNSVIPVMMIYPRPRTLEKMEQAIKDFEEKAPPRTTDEEREEHLEKRKAMLLLEFSIYDDAKLKKPRIFHINYKKIESIFYYEDLMLKRIDILRQDYRIRDAFELLHQLRRRSPDWEGIDQSHNKILFSAAEKSTREKKYEDALFKLEELHDRDSRFPRLGQAMGVVINHLIQISIDKKDYRQGRFFMRRLGKFFPKHEVIAKWTKILSGQCKKLMLAADKSYKEKKYQAASVTIKQAAKVWPRMSGLARAFNRINQRYQVLKAGVIDQPGPNQSPINTDGNSRYLELTVSRLFELDQMEDIPHYRTKYFEQWTPTDLGRQTVFDLRPGRSYWESQPVIYSSDLATVLRNKLNPSHKNYDQRLEYFIDSISVNSPYRLEIIFSHVPLKPETLFRFPFPAVRNPNSKNDLPNQLKPMRFQLAKKTDSLSHYARVKAEPDGMKLEDYHISEIVEVKFPDYEHAVQSMIREQIDYLPKVPPAMARTLTEDERFFVLPYSIPEVHIIQFNPRSQAIRNRQIRRAMAYSLDLPEILRKNLLNSVPYLNANVTSAPFARNNYAFNKTIVPRKFDLSAAVPLVLITKKKLGGNLPELKMLANPEPEAMRAAKTIVKKWNQIGLPVRLMTEKDNPDDWDLAYRSIKMTDPIAEMWSFIANDPQHKIESLNHLPDWLRQEMIQLERTSNWNEAVRTLQKLHRHLYEEVEYIPLWEIYQNMVITKKATGFSENPISPYHNIERWIMTPWYSKQYQ